jgi:dTMP kinase
MFIAFEGLDGSGKSTLIGQLKLELTTKGQYTDQAVVVTREPGGTVLGDDIRHLLLRTESEAPVARAELLLYIAGRAQHVEKVIRPALLEKKWVLCDRYSASSVAFQAGGRELKRGDIDWLNNFATAGVIPDLWVLLDLTSEEAAKRMTNRDLDRFERESKPFHDRVRNAYLELARAGKNWLVLDAALSPEVLREKLLSDLRARGWLK